uniref:Uncharacterized protein n=1 Tax=Acrobeloides nanus TaxID=290746 RepID=A0A914DMS9_9BILA
VELIGPPTNRIKSGLLDTLEELMNQYEYKMDN